MGASESTSGLRPSRKGKRNSGDASGSAGTAPAASAAAAAAAATVSAASAASTTTAAEATNVAGAAEADLPSTPAGAAAAGGFGGGGGGGGAGSPPPRRGSIGKSMSSKRFKKGGAGATQWKIFNDLDVHDDKMMIELAVFLRRLEKGAPVHHHQAGGGAHGGGAGGLKRRPSVKAGGDTMKAIDEDSREGMAVDGEGEDGGAADMAAEATPADLFSATNTDGDDDDMDMDHHTWGSGDGSRRGSLNSMGQHRGSLMGRYSGTIDLDNIQLEERPIPALVRIGSVDVNLGSESSNLSDYNLGKAPPSVETVHEVVQLYAAGGRLSTKSLRRILRDAYKVLKELPNVSRLNMSPKGKVVVVGDLHGQLGDLLHLLDHHGFPDEHTSYVFNGDFVDRGAMGTEVLVLLFMLLVVWPDRVTLNRGNHEDFGLCCVYGFQQECLSKYNDVIFSMFSEMFRHLPMCTLVHERVLVIHGGLFHREHVTISDLEQVDRLEYVVPSRQDIEEDESGMSDEELREKDLRTLMHCALWSDPDLEPCLPHPAPNPRGAGVLFGPDITSQFLDENRLDMVVRSHECVEDGFDMPFEGDEEGCCATVFSASNYGGSMNRGATMTFTLTDDDDEGFVAGGELAQEPFVYFTVYDWQLTKAAGGGAGRTVLEGLTKANRHGLSSLVLRKKKLLTNAFEQVDKQKSGWISVDRWERVMSEATGLVLAWPALMPILVADEDKDGDLIHWQRFLSKFHVQLSLKNTAGEVGSTHKPDGKLLFDAMYSNRDRLEAIFRFFDADGNGVISRDEFQRGCEFINSSVPEEEKLENWEAWLDVMDLDQNDSVDINEFFEVFRLCNISLGAADTG